MERHCPAAVLHFLPLRGFPAKTRRVGRVQDVERMRSTHVGGAS